MPLLLQTNPWRFAGGYFDSAAGFTKFGVRYYDATTGRWTQQDPKAGSLFDPRSSNRYVYAKCDPVNVTDPGGKDPTGCDFLVPSAILGYIGAAIAAAGPLAAFAEAAATGLALTGLGLPALLAAIGVAVAALVLLGTLEACASSFPQVA